MEKYIMSLDQGTTSCRCILFNGAGEIVSEFGGDTGVQVTYTNPAVEAIDNAELPVTCGVVIG